MKRNIDQDNNQDAEKGSSLKILTSFSASTGSLSLVDIDFFRREKNEQNLSALFELPVSNTILESQPLLALRNEMYESDNASQ